MNDGTTTGAAAAARLLDGPWGAPPAYQPPSPEQREELAKIYAEVESATDSAPEACRACGQCCRFEAGGMMLFASAIEMAYLVSEAGWPPAAAATGTDLPHVVWRCPYQQENVCGARRARTLACRTYFCNRTVRGRGEGLYVAFLRKIQRLGNPGPVPAGEGQGQWWYGPAQVYLMGSGPVRK